jgi:hypothetical protein
MEGACEFVEVQRVMRDAIACLLVPLSKIRQTGA